MHYPHSQAPAYTHANQLQIFPSQGDFCHKKAFSDNGLFLFHKILQLMMKSQFK